MGKNYVESAKLIDKSTLYSPNEAIDLVIKTAKAKFDETIELAVRLGVDPRHADQQVRGAVVLPYGTGKTVRVLVFAKGEKAKEAEAAGADYVGAEEYINKIQKENWFDFDVVNNYTGHDGCGWQIRKSAWTKRFDAKSKIRYSYI